MQSRQRLMSVLIGTLAVLAVPLSAWAKNHDNNNDITYRSTAAPNAPANNLLAFKSTPATSSSFHQGASRNRFFGGRANRTAFWNNSTAVNTPARYYGTAVWNRGVTPVYNNYVTSVPGYVAAPLRPVYYGGYQSYPATYAAPYSGYGAPYAGYAAPAAGYAAPYVTAAFRAAILTRQKRRPTTSTS